MFSFMLAARIPSASLIVSVFSTCRFKPLIKLPVVARQKIGTAAKITGWQQLINAVGGLWQQLRGLMLHSVC